MIGNSNSHYIYGISARINYKGFDFSMVWRGVAKRDLFVDGTLKMGNERTFFAKQKFGNLRVNSEGQARATHVVDIAQDLAVDVIANGLPG